MRDIRNIGIFAHVDAGKTTLSEQLLVHTGAVRSRGSVDNGTAHTDLLPVERRRGISVKATCVRLSYGETEIHLIDTPGHADFSAEVERSLWALDGAVLVVCAAEGVEPQTEVLFDAMQREGLPVLFFLNKTDRVGADVERTMHELRRLLTEKAVFPGDTERLTELVCDRDDELMERYLEGEMPERELLRSRFAEMCRRGEAYPVFTGSALRDEGVEALLDGIVEYLPPPERREALSGVVFAARQEHNMGRGVWVRLFGGSLENRDGVAAPMGTDPFTGEKKTETRKITQILSPDGTPTGHLEAGEIGVLYGLGDLPVGYVFGDTDALPRSVKPGSLGVPLITVQAVPEKPEELETLRRALFILSGEDPLLEVEEVSVLNELRLRVMGKIQLEIIEEILRTRFGIGVRFSPPAVLYRETIRTAGEGYVAYLAPKPCWAILRFRLEPGERNSGVTFSSEVPVRMLQTRYQNQTAQAIPLALRQGRLGWQVTDVKLTLIEGGEHKFHTHPLDFIVATPMAIHDGLSRCGSVLLEPILEVRFRLPGDTVGRVMSDVITMRGEVLDSVADGDRVLLRALVPVETSIDYSVTLSSVTGGRGSMSVKLHGYRECPPGTEKTAPRRSVDPLDTSKYILAARSALEGGIFDTD